MLSDAFCKPDLNDEDWEFEAECFGLCDTSVYAVPAGGSSEYMPEVYKPLYNPGLDSSVQISGLA